MVARNLIQFHEAPAVIAWWCRTGGPVLVWLAPPARRRAILAFAALLVAVGMTHKNLAKHPGIGLPTSAIGVAMVVAAQFVLFWLVLRTAAGFAQLPAPVRRHPQVALHASYWAVLCLLWLTTPAIGPWRQVVLGLAVIYPMLLWRLGYLLASGQHGRMTGTGWRDHALYLWPAYGGSETPYGKGLAYLSQHEADTAESLARSQLAGSKLLLLAVVWRLVLTLYEGVLYGEGNRLTDALGGATLGLPTLTTLIAMGSAAPKALGWASIYGDLFADVLRLAIKGHLIVGFLRLCGFHVFRNTYKPLLAESIVEFWNRYFYYFKELLVTFFFLPTFTGVGKRLRRWPKMRLLVAVFAAAFVGNAYYHLIKMSAAMAQGQVLQTLSEQAPRMFYCLLLACGIFVSMLREQARRGVAPMSGRAPRALRIFGVWTFFGLISIWNAGGGVSFPTRIDFFLGLWGLA